MTTQIVLPYDRSPATGTELDKDFELLESLRPYIGMVKIGLEAMTAGCIKRRRNLNVADSVREKMHANSVPVLWDMKLHDIGNTTAAAFRNLASNGMTDWVTVHASSSQAALEACVAARKERVASGRKYLGIFAVTVLTDIGGVECTATYGKHTEDAVLGYAEKALKAGIDGIVCSGKELSILSRHGYLGELKTLVPGLRSSWAGNDDQQRVMTPAEATSLGATYAVVGRQIMKAPNPLEAAQRTYEEIRAASR